VLNIVYILASLICGGTIILHALKIVQFSTFVGEHLLTLVIFYPVGLSVLIYVYYSDAEEYCLWRKLPLKLNYGIGLTLL
jgi:hypothetical protein